MALRRRSSGRRAALWVGLLALAVLVPRGWLVARAQSERADDDWHLVRGVLFLRGDLGAHPELALNDPPVGGAVTALPALALGCWDGSEVARSALWGHRCPAERILAAVAVWRSLLAVPLVVLAFVWLRRLYGARSAWLAAGLLLVEPTLAAHVPVAAVDVLGLSGIAAACFLCWRAFERPGPARLAAAAASVACALVLKHTAVVLLPVAAGYAAVWWLVQPWREGRLRASWRGAVGPRAGALAVAACVCALALFALCGFDVSRPLVPLDARVPELRDWLARHPAADELVRRPWPAGVYWTSLLEAWQHGRLGHPAHLFGETRKHGWWYYYPVVAVYKTPLGFAAVLAAGAASLAWLRPRRGEWSLAVPMLAWTAFLLASPINIGFRHFLPAYLFMLLLAARSVADDAQLRPARRAALLAGAWLAVAGSALHAALAYHPHYLGYLNLPRDRPWLAISDSNLDWGHGMLDVRRWIEAHPDRAVAVRATMLLPENVRRWLGQGPTVLERSDPPPTAGVLIISVTAVTGQYERADPYRPLRALDPDERLAHGMLVYDLDRLRAQGTPVQWPPRRHALAAGAPQAAGHGSVSPPP